MALPDRDVVMGWVGKAVVDRDGAEIGVCSGVFADDATGLPEWARAEFGGLSLFVPVLGAVESGGEVRVTVSRAEVASAPPVGDARHLSEDEEAALYRHYGIQFSRAASESLLPDDAAGSPAAAVPADTSAVTTGGAPARRGRRLLVLGGGLGSLLGGLLGVRRLRPRPAPARSERLTAGAWAASAALTARGGQFPASAAPLLDTGKQVIRRAAQAGAAVVVGTAASPRPVVVRAATKAAGSTRRAAQLAATVGQTSLRRTATAGRIAASAASAAGSQAAQRADAALSKATAARESGIRGGQRVGGAVMSVPEVLSERTERLQNRWSRAIGKLTMGLSFGAGYVLGSRAGQERFQQLKQTAASVARRPEVQQTRDRVKRVAGNKLPTGTGRVTRASAEVTELHPRRSTSTGPVSDAETPLFPAPGTRIPDGLPPGLRETQEP